MEKQSLGRSLRNIFNPSLWSNDAFIQNEKAKRYDALVKKGLPETFYIAAGGYHNYSQVPGFAIVDPARFSSLIYGGHASHNFIELFHCVPEIFAPVHAIASRIANADFQLRKWYNDEIVYNNRDWNRLYERPNPLQHFRELIYEAVVYEYVTGNELMYFNTPSTLERNYTNVSTIWNLPADKIEVVGKKPLKLYTATSLEDIVETYKLDEKNSFSPKDVLHKPAVGGWQDKRQKPAAKRRQGHCKPDRGLRGPECHLHQTRRVRGYCKPQERRERVYCLDEGRKRCDPGGNEQHLWRNLR
jgi:hypothetical protein